jgi:hypothetical protein
MKATRDFLWKTAFRFFMRQFIAFFYPHRYNQIDWTRKVEFLDKELHRIFTESGQKHRQADVLARLHLKSGKPLWVLLHIEVQGYVDEYFAFRIHQIRYRIEERFGVNPAILAILTDNNPKFHPKRYRVSTWRASSETRFQTYKVINHPPSSYDNADSAVAIIMKVAYYAAHAGKFSDEDLISVHFKMVRELLSANYSKQEVAFILNFIKGHVNFKNPTSYPIFESNLNDMEELEYETTEEILAYWDFDARMAKAKEALQEVELKMQQAELKNQQVEQQKQEAELQKQQAELKVQQAVERIEKSVLKHLEEGMDKAKIADLFYFTVEDVEAIIQRQTGTTNSKK